jgi:NTE family protein
MPKRALVLGGGGPVFIAWESGMLAGLAESGLDLSDADFILGTSAGSVVGSQLAMGRSSAALSAPFLNAPEQQQVTSPSQLLGPAPPDLATLIQKMAQAALSTAPPEQARAELGVYALQSQTMPEQDFIRSFGHTIADYPENSWPDRFACTAVDTADGSFHVWNKDSKVSLARAVASSCSVPGIFPPVTVNGRRYMDGGMRSATNADVAKGCDIVFVFALSLPPSAPALPMIEALRRRLDNEIETLRASGSRVELILPDPASFEAFGLNMMDYRRRPASAAAGLARGRAIAKDLAPAWPAP